MQFAPPRDRDSGRRLIPCRTFCAARPSRRPFWTAPSGGIKQKRGIVTGIPAVRNSDRASRVKGRSYCDRPQLARKGVAKSADARGVGSDVALVVPRLRAHVDARSRPGGPDTDDDVVDELEDPGHLDGLEAGGTEAQSEDPEADEGGGRLKLDGQRSQCKGESAGHPQARGEGRDTRMRFHVECSLP